MNFPMKQSDRLELVYDGEHDFLPKENRQWIDWRLYLNGEDLDWVVWRMTTKGHSVYHLTIPGNPHDRSFLDFEGAIKYLESEFGDEVQLPQGLRDYENQLLRSEQSLVTPQAGNSKVADRIDFKRYRRKGQPYPWSSWKAFLNGEMLDWSILKIDYISEERYVVYGFGNMGHARFLNWADAETLVQRTWGFDVEPKDESDYGDF